MCSALTVLMKAAHLRNHGLCGNSMHGATTALAEHQCFGGQACLALSQSAARLRRGPFHTMSLTVRGGGCACGTQGVKLLSADGTVYLVNPGDGSLQLVNATVTQTYPGSIAAVIWSSGTAGATPAPFNLLMQEVCACVGGTGMQVPRGPAEAMS